MLNIIYMDKNYIVCQKPIGVSSQKANDNKDMISLISKETDISLDNIYPVHRLDNIVGGTMVYALNKKSAAALSKLISENKLKKYYLAVIHGRPENESDIFNDFLFKDSKTNKSFVVNRVRKGVKEASLEYKVLDTIDTDSGKFSLVKILLHTGRTHQIRVQFSSRKMSLLGDRRYGSGKDNCPIALWSNIIEFTSPFDNKDKKYVSFPNCSDYPWCLFDTLLINIHKNC